jgi:hypothetical protein
MTLKKKIFVPIVLSISLFFSASVFAGDPPPVGGDPTTDPGAAPIGGSAPIGSGLVIIIGMGAAYAGKKTFHIQEEEK